MIDNRFFLEASKMMLGGAAGGQVVQTTGTAELFSPEFWTNSFEIVFIFGIVATSFWAFEELFPTQGDQTRDEVGEKAEEEPRDQDDPPRVAS